MLNKILATKVNKIKQIATEIINSTPTIYSEPEMAGTLAVKRMELAGELIRFADCAIKEEV